MTTAAPPRPRANPLLGSALDLRRSRIRTYERVMREYGDVVRLVVGPPGVRFDLHCVFHPDGVKAVLAGSREGYSKRTRFYRQIAEAFGWGLRESPFGRAAPFPSGRRHAKCEMPHTGLDRPVWGT